MSLTFRRNSAPGHYFALRYSGSLAPIGSWNIRRDDDAPASQRWALYRVHNNSMIRTMHVPASLSGPSFGGYATLTDAKRGAEFLEVLIANAHADALVMARVLANPAETIDQVATITGIDLTAADLFSTYTLETIGRAILDYQTRDGSALIGNVRARALASWFIRKVLWPYRDAAALEAAHLAQANIVKVGEATPPRYFEVPVVFDVMADTATKAAEAVSVALQSVGFLGYDHTIESWWMLYAEHKSVDNDDNDAGTIVYDRHYLTILSALNTYKAMGSDVDVKLLAQFTALANQES